MTIRVRGVLLNQKMEERSVAIAVRMYTALELELADDTTTRGKDQGHYYQTSLVATGAKEINTLLSFALTPSNSANLKL